MEGYLNDRLKVYNQTIENPFRENWGSALSYLPASQQLMGEKIDEVQMYKDMALKHKIQLDERLKKQHESEVQKYKEMYGSKRFGIKDGRPAPQNPREEARYGNVERKVMVAQNDLRKMQPIQTLSQGKQDDEILKSKANAAERNSKFEIEFNKTTVSAFNKDPSMREINAEGVSFQDRTANDQRPQTRGYMGYETIDPPGNMAIRIDQQMISPPGVRTKFGTMSTQNQQQKQFAFDNVNDQNFASMAAKEKSIGMMHSRNNSKNMTTNHNSKYTRPETNQQTGEYTAIQSKGRNRQTDFFSSQKDIQNSSFPASSSQRTNQGIIKAQKSHQALRNTQRKSNMGNHEFDRGNHKRAISNMIGRERLGQTQTTDYGQGKSFGIQKTDNGTQDIIIKDCEDSNRAKLLSYGQNTLISSDYGEIQCDLNDDMHLEAKLQRDLQKLREDINDIHQRGASIGSSGITSAVIEQRAQVAHNRSLANSKNIANAKKFLSKKLIVPRNQGFYASQAFKRQSQGGPSQVNSGEFGIAASQSTANSKIAELLGKDSDLPDMNFVNKNIQKSISMVYHAKKIPESAKNDHVFKLQTSMRLATKFTGATNSIGKAKNMPQMKCRSSATSSFKHQAQMINNIKHKSENRVNRIIYKNTSIKESVKIEIDKQNKIDLMKSREENSNSNTCDSTQDTSKDKKTSEDKDKASGFIENPRAINPQNKLQLAMIKHIQNEQEAVTDMFSKKPDPVDNYLELQLLSKQMKDALYLKDLNQNKQHSKGHECENQKERKLQKLKEELSEWYKHREIHQKTPRKFDEVKNGVQKFYSRFDESAQKCPKTYLNEENYIKRECTLKAVEEMTNNQHRTSPGQDKINKMPLELRSILDIDPEEENCIYKLMGLSKKQFLIQEESKKFMLKHNFSTARLQALVDNIVFSKQFFGIMDDSGDGGIELEELAQPLIALGLATDTGFVQKALKVLNPAKFGNGQFQGELTMKEFSRIFRTDPVSEKLNKLIKEQLNDEYEKKIMKQKIKAQQENCLQCDLETMNIQVNITQPRMMLQGFDQTQFEDMVDYTGGEMNLSTDLYQERDRAGSILENSWVGQTAPRITKTNVNFDDNLSHDQRDDHRYQRYNSNKPMQTLLSDNFPQTGSEGGSAQMSVLKNNIGGFQQQQQQYQQAPALKPAKVDKDAKRVYDINDQVHVVKNWWKKLQNTEILDVKDNIKSEEQKNKEKGNQQQQTKYKVPLKVVAQQFIEWQIFQDQTTAIRYLAEAVGEGSGVGIVEFDFNYFLAVFIKGIFKDVVTGIASTVSNFKRPDEKSMNPSLLKEKSLLWKLSDYKRENLFQLVKKGMIKSRHEKQKIVERPIFENLYNLKYRSDPDKWKNANYENYLDKTIHGYPKVDDPYEIPKDSFQNQINFIKINNHNEMEAFNQIINDNKKLSFNNEDEFVQDIALKKKMLDQERREKLPANRINKLYGPKLTEEEQQELLDQRLREIMYPGDVIKDGFSLNNEKQEHEVKRAVDRYNIVDNLSLRQREDQEKAQLQDIIIEKHDLAEKRMDMYNNPRGGGLSPEDMVENDFENMQANNSPKPQQSTVGGVANVELEIFDKINCIREDGKRKFDLMERLQKNIKKDFTSIDLEGEDSDEED